MPTSKESGLSLAETTLKENSNPHSHTNSSERPPVCECGPVVVVVVGGVGALRHKEMVGEGIGTLEIQLWKKQYPSF